MKKKLTLSNFISTKAVMIKIYILFFSILVFNSCNSQTNSSLKQVVIHPTEKDYQKKSQNGIIFFSYDNGNNWINSSNGLPENMSIGLGGIATSSHFLGVATKEHGIYQYNFNAKIWENIPTHAQIIEANIGALGFIDNTIFVGTQFKGIFYTKDNGRNWTSLNLGLTNLTIRRFCEFDNVLYVCTNDGFYSLNKRTENWHLEHGQNSLQTNGATVYNGRFYLATNRGIFTQQTDKSWIHSSPQFSVHNISSDKNQLYAMTYNELLLSSPDGTTWQSQQNGLPKELYTFNVLNHNGSVFVGQWDGIYRKTIGNSTWELSSKGLPSKFAVTNLKTFNDILVISTSERKLKEGMTPEK